MTVQLTPQLESIIEQMIASGHYASATDVVDRAVHLLDAHERQLDALRAKLQIGLDEEERGELIEYTPDFMDELVRESEEAFLRGEKPDPDVWP